MVAIQVKKNLSAKLWSPLIKYPWKELSSVAKCCHLIYNSCSFTFQNDGFKKRNIGGISFLITFWIKWKFVIQTVCCFVLTCAVFILFFILGKGYNLFSVSKLLLWWGEEPWCITFCIKVLESHLVYRKEQCVRNFILRKHERGKDLEHSLRLTSP